MLYLLDTNTVSYAVRGQLSVNQRLKETPREYIALSSIVEAELLHGLVKKPQATRSMRLAKNFLAHIDILPWDSYAANSYAELQAFFIQHGKMLSTMDALIAAHAHAVGATLVTSDKAFFQISDFLPVEDWTSSS